MVGDLKNGCIVYLLVKLFCFYDVMFCYVLFVVFLMFEFVKEYVWRKGIYQVSDSCSCFDDSGLIEVLIGCKSFEECIVDVGRKLL